MRRCWYLGKSIGMSSDDCDCMIGYGSLIHRVVLLDMHLEFILLPVGRCAGILPDMLYRYHMLLNVENRRHCDEDGKKAGECIYSVSRSTFTQALEQWR